MLTFFNPKPFLFDQKKIWYRSLGIGLCTSRILLQAKSVTGDEQYVMEHFIKLYIVSRGFPYYLCCVFELWLIFVYRPMPSVDKHFIAGL